MALEFDFPSSIINVTNPQTDVLCQDLADAIRDAEDELVPGLAYPKIADMTGKQDLGGGVFVGITIELLDNWQVKFWAGSYIAKISGGNLVGGPVGDPIAYTAGVQVLLIQSAASTIIDLGDLADDISGAVWDDTTVGHNDTGTFGEAIRRILWRSR